MPFLSEVTLSELISSVDDNTAFELVKLLPKEELVALFKDKKNRYGCPTLLHTVAANIPTNIEYIHYLLHCFQQAAIVPTVDEDKELPAEQKEPARILDSIVNLGYIHKPKRSQNLLYLFASNPHMTPILWKLLHSLISQPALELAWNDNFYEGSECSFIREAVSCQSPECLEVIINAQKNQKSYDMAMLKRVEDYHLNIPFVLAAKDIKKFTLLVERASSDTLHSALQLKATNSKTTFISSLSEELFDYVFKKIPYEKWVEALKSMISAFSKKHHKSYECTELFRIFLDGKTKMFKTLINTLTQQDLNDNFTALTLNTDSVRIVMANPGVSDADLPAYAEIISHLEKKLYPRLLLMEDLQFWSEYLSVGYEFCLEPELNPNEVFVVEPNKIYVKPSDAVMIYTVTNPQGERVTEAIDEIELGSEFPDPFTLEALTPHFPRILAITTARTHTAESERVAFIRRYSHMKEVLLSPEKSMRSTPNEFITFFREHVSQVETIPDFLYWETELKENIKLAKAKKLNQVRDALLIVLAQGYFTMHSTTKTSTSYHRQAYQALISIDSPNHLDTEDNQFIGDELTAVGFKNSDSDHLEHKEKCQPIEHLQFVSAKKTYPEIYQQGLMHLRAAEINQDKRAKKLMSLRSISMFGLSDEDKTYAYPPSLANKMVATYQAVQNLRNLGWNSFCILIQAEYDKLISSDKTTFSQELLRLKLLFEMANSTNRIDISRKILALLQEEDKKINSPVNITLPTLFKTTEKDTQADKDSSYGRWISKMLEVMRKIDSKVNEQTQRAVHRTTTIKI